MFDEKIREFVKINSPKVFRLEKPSALYQFDEGQVVYISGYDPSKLKLPQGVKLEMDEDEFQRKYYFITDGANYAQIVSSDDVRAAVAEAKTFEEAMSFCG